MGVRLLGRKSSRARGANEWERNMNDGAETIDGYVCPTDPMDGLECEGCQ